MKKDIVTISFEAEKLRAVKKYSKKKDINLQDEITEQLQKMYEKYVPAGVREYIDEKENEEKEAEKKKISKKGTEDMENKEKELESKKYEQ